MPRIVACGGRQEAFKDFVTALRTQKAGSMVMLLVDSEGPVDGTDPWAHLLSRDRWQRPPDARPEQCHLMVQIMESWFLADPEAIEKFFGAGFRKNALPANSDIEEIERERVISSLERAAHGCAKAGYRKGAHSFALLGTIDPGKLEAAAPFAKRFFETLRSG